MKPQTRWRMVHWVAPVVVSALIFLALMMVLVYNTGDHKPPANQTFDCYTKKQAAITFRNTIVIECFLNTSQINRTLHLRLVMIESEEEPETEIFKLAANSTFIENLWNITIGAHGNDVTLTRSAVTCAGTGKYRADITIGSERQSLGIDVENIVAETSVSLSRDTGDLSGSISYGVTCSLRSGCHPVPVILLGNQGNSVTPIYDVNLTCISLYSSEEGWTMECSGVVMEVTLKSMSRLICRSYPSYLAQESSIPTNSLFLSGPPHGCKNSAIGRTFLDPWSCRVYHRCLTESVLVSQSCNKDMHFDSRTCTCRNIDAVSECDHNGERGGRSTVTSCTSIE
ncbi:uncharacterized protein LOC117341659 [Pecten maximus]|uniref:uncharacterized protein LOC117341659 n=1 Tax=Pecten maximus TaxID=6579 RepID=UPI00145844E8|nr:uncharacterized protein LOC117341659 [Pecten maximus]